MPTKDVQFLVLRNMLWKETRKYLKHYRIQYSGDLERYNVLAGKIIELYRKMDYEVNVHEFITTRKAFIEKIKELEKE